MFSNNYLRNYMQEEREEKMSTEPDEEGWIKVTRKGKNAGFARSEAKEIKLKAKLKRQREKNKVSDARGCYGDR